MIRFILISSIMIISLYLILILISFNPADPSWLQNNSWHGFVYNIGGVFGARISDFLFFTFGILAYIIPLAMLFYLWKFYKKNIHISIFTMLCELLKLSMLLSICCGCLNLIIVDDFFYFSSGGIIGCVLCDWIFFCENKMQFYINLLLFFVGLINVTLMVNQSLETILKIKTKKLFGFKSILKIFFHMIKKIRFRHIYRKFCGQLRICPTVRIKKSHDNFRNSLELLKKKKSSNVFFDMNKCLHQIHSKLENNYINKTYINFSSIMKKENNITSVALSCFDVHKNVVHIDHHQKKYVNFDQRICKNKKLYFLKNKECKKDNFLKKKFYFSDIINNNIDSQFASIQKNIESYSFKPKRIDVSKTYNIIQNFSYPNINFLKESVEDNISNNVEWKNVAQLLEKKLREYRIITNVVNIISGPVITRFELNLSPGMKSSKIVSLSRDLARALSVISVRVVEIIPGTPYVGLEIPNQQRKIVRLRSIIESDQFREINTPLALALGQDISGNPIIEDLRRMPHLLVAGTTGSGKSIGINSMIISILYKAQPNEVRFIMIDPKLLELSIYSKVPHILNTVITNVCDVDKTLKWCVQEMEYRYQLMAVLGVRNLESYNFHVEQFYSERSTKSGVFSNLNNDSILNFKKKLKKLPYIVIIIDEFSDLIISSEKKIEKLIIQLIQKARAAGIHLILATQRPSVNVVTGLIKANIPARIAFTVSSKIDSYTIIGQSGAESLLGMGDMLYLSSTSPIPIRVHGAYIQDQEIYAVVNFWKNQKK